MREIDPGKKLTDIVMFDGAFNVQLGGNLFKVHYPKLTDKERFQDIYSSQQKSHIQITT